MTTVERTIEAPGPGAWELDAVHFPKLLTRFVSELAPEPFAIGFQRSTALYGLMLDRFQPGPQHGVWYHRVVPFGAPEGAMGTPPREVFEAITRENPVVRERLASGVAAFERRAWREDLREWDAVVKPRANAAHLALQAQDPERMSAAELARHLAACVEQLKEMWKQHHDYTASALMPVGDYLAHAQDWTGLPAGELLRPLKGSSPVSRGAAARELERLGAIARASTAARAALDSLDAAAALRTLRSEPGDLGAATRAWLDVAGYRSLGYDIAEPFALELPEMLVGALRASMDAGAAEATAQAEIDRAAASIRARVPAAHAAQFDELLAEARLINRLRDERGNYSDAWATGLTRRAVLAAGQRLASDGVLEDPLLAIDATHGEIVSLLEGRGGPTSAELADHRAWRTGHEAAQFPPWFGAPPSPPPPSDWLPEHARRPARAIEAAIAALFTEPEARVEGATLTGLPVSAGTYEGVARVVLDPHEFGRLQRGDVLVTRATSATFNVVLPLLGAIVTDRGGQLCHAAIVARERGLPGVVGTRHATTRIADGARVRVDGGAGTVTVLS